VATSLVELIADTREAANVERSNFVTDPTIIRLLNYARRQLREQIITADDSYYQATDDFSISGWPNNTRALPTDFWKMRGLDCFAGDSIRQHEVFAREFRNRFDPGLGYYFGGTGNTLVVCGQSPEQGNPFRLSYVPYPRPLAALETRTITPDEFSGTNGSSQLVFLAGGFTSVDIGGTITIAGSSGGTLDGTRTILTIVSSTTITATPTPPPGVTTGLTATVTVTRQPAGTDAALDITEDAFAEYLPTRAAYRIARKKRQDSLVAQLAADRVAIEERIAALARSRQSEPQQAPVLWGRRSQYPDDFDV
jgi:hypothetical protein